MNKEKEQIAKQILKRDILRVYLNPKMGNSILPPHLHTREDVCLEFGYNLPIPIPDLVVTAAGISGTLSFTQKPYFCAIPWGCVFALSDYNERGKSWPEDAPEWMQPEFKFNRKPTHVPYLWVVK